MKAKYLIPALADIDTTPRLYFHSRIENRETILSRIIGHEIEIKQNPVVHLPTSETNPIIAVDLDSTDPLDCVHLIRNQSEPKLIKDYVPSYLTSSLLHNVMFCESIGIKYKLETIMFTWYYYWFITSNKDITNITHNVCFQLEEMIKQIINKELGIYRGYNTADAVASLRLRLSSERLVNMGSTSKGINFRR